MLVHIWVLQVHAGDAHHLGNRWRNNLRVAWPESIEAEGTHGRGTRALAERAACDLGSWHVRHPQLHHSAYAKRENLRCHSQLDGHLVKLDWLYTICFVNSFFKQFLWVKVSVSLNFNQNLVLFVYSWFLLFEMDVKLWSRVYIIMLLNWSLKLHLKPCGDENIFLQRCWILVLYIILILDMIELVIFSEVMVAEWVVPKMHFITLFGDTGIEPATSRTDSTLSQKSRTKGGKTTAWLNFPSGLQI